MPGFPDKYMPFVQPSPTSRLYTGAARYGHGALFRFFRERRMRTVFDIEPTWRRPSERLETGYHRSW
jgi:hydrogenase small subunit